MFKIAIDIGGTTIKGVLLDENKIIKEFSAPTNGKLGLDKIKQNLFFVIDNLMCENVKIIGISSAGNIDYKNGVCVYATDNLKGFTGFKIAEEVQVRYNIKTVVDNDAICALKSQIEYYGTDKTLVMITFGTGIGGAVLSNGKIIRGKNFDSARLGHTVLVPNGRPCNCGKLGCAETYLSCTALYNEAKKLIPNLEGVKQLFALYKTGDKNAKIVMKEFAFYLNIFLDNIRTFYSPDAIIFSGGLTKDFDILLSLIDKKDDIKLAKNAQYAGCLGSLVQID